MRIKYKFITSFLIIVVIFMLAGAVINLNVESMEAATGDLIKNMDVDHNTRNYEKGAKDLQIGVYLYVHENKEMGRQFINDGSNLMKTSKTNLKGLLSADVSKLSDLADIEKHEEGVIDAANQVIKVTDNKESTALIEQNLKTLQGRVEALNLKLSIFVDSSHENMMQSIDKSKAYGETTKNITIYASLIALAVSVIVAFILAGHLTKPLRRLSDIANKVSKGDIQEKVDIHSKDEIGELAESLKRMVNAFKIMDALSREK